MVEASDLRYLLVFMFIIKYVCITVNMTWLEGGAFRADETTFLVGNMKLSRQRIRIVRGKRPTEVFSTKLYVEIEICGVNAVWRCFSISVLCSRRCDC